MKAHEDINVPSVLCILITFYLFCSSFQLNIANGFSEEAAIKTLVMHYFSAYTQRNLKAFISLWHKGSPEIEQLRKTLQKSFAITSFSFSNIAFSHLRIERNKAFLRASFDQIVTDLRTKAKRTERLHRTFVLVKELGTWKIWRCYPAEEDLAQMLTSEMTDEDRRKLLAEERELLTKRLVQSLNEQTEDLRLRSNYQQALIACRLAQEIAKQIGDRIGLAKALENLGNIHIDRGEYESALKCLYESLTISTQEGDRKTVASILNSIGNVYSDQGNYTLALEFYRRSLAEYEAMEDKMGIANVLNDIGIVYDLQGCYELALEFYQKSLAQYRAIGDKYGISAVLNNIGDIYLAQGNPSLALEFFRKSLVIDFELGDRGGIAITLNSIGNAYAAQGKYQLALEFYRKCLAEYEALSDKSGIASVLSDIGDVYVKQGNHSLAFEFYRKGLAVAEAIGDYETAFHCYASIGDIQKSQKEFEKAIISYQKAISIVEEARWKVAGRVSERQQFLEVRIKPYYSFVDLLIEQGKFADALHSAERAKARTLLDLMQLGRVNFSEAITPKEKEQEDRLRSEIVSLNAQIVRERSKPKPDTKRLAELEGKLKQARLEYEAFLAILHGTHSEIKSQRSEASIITLKEVGQFLLNEKTTLLEFVVTEDKTFLFIITGERNKPMLYVHSLNVDMKTLKRTVNNFRERIAKRSVDFSSSARELYDLLLKPVEDCLKGKDLLVIIPDNILWELPFQALQGESGKFLIEDHSLVYAPSLTALREMMFKRKGRNESLNLLAVGNPKLEETTTTRVKLAQRDVHLYPLPTAEDEVRQLGQLYGLARSRVYTGATAKEKQVKKEISQYRIVHFATHGLINDASPMYSHLLLVPGDGEDGLLEAWEIMELDLHTDIVVLSACETARGKLRAGEGVIGLAWALFVAGSPTNVVSQWKVADESTAKLMVEFHRNLLAGKSKAESLREAQLELMKDTKYRHPFFWAAFIVIGDWR